WLSASRLMLTVLSLMWSERCHLFLQLPKCYKLSKPFSRERMHVCKWVRGRERG
ncbi:Hypothetical predicted protein, partial [Lynx pardinus]